MTDSIETKTARMPWWAGLLPALLAALLYAPVVDNGFVYDDQVLLVDNPSIETLASALEGFNRPFWSISGDSRREGAGYYRPIPILGFALAAQIDPGEPWTFHTLNLVVHALCALLVAALAWRFAGSAWAACAAGLLFAVHGAHVEAVAWASALPDLLATLFSLLALHALWKPRLWLCSLWLILAMLSKESAIGTAALAVGIVLWRDFRNWRALLWVFGAMAAVYALRVNAFDSASAGFDQSVLQGLVFLPGEERPSPFALLASYVGFLTWPWPHAPFRPLNLQSDLLLHPLVIAAGVFIVVAGAAVWLRFGRRSGFVLGGLGLMLAGFLPVLNVELIGQFPFEERFVYLPSAGFALVVAGLFFAPASPLRRAAWAGPAMVLFLVMAAGHAASSYFPQKHWQNEQAFFRWATEASPNAMTSWIGLGDLMLRAAQLSEDPQEKVAFATNAERAFTRALEVDSAEWFVVSTDREFGNNGLASSLLLQGDLKAAENMFRQILERFPHSLEARLNLALSIGGQAYDWLSRGRRDLAEPMLRDAIRQYEVVLSGHPDHTAALQGKASLHGYLEEYSTARPLLERAVALEPDNFGYVFDLASVLWELVELKEAQRVLERFLARNPQHPMRTDIEASISELQRLEEQRP